MAKNSGIRALKNLKNKIGEKSSAVKTQRVIVNKKTAKDVSSSFTSANSRMAGKKASSTDHLEKTPKKMDKPEKTRRFMGGKHSGVFSNSGASALPASRFGRRKKGFVGRAWGWLSSLFFKKSDTDKTQDALAFADNNKRLGRKGRRNRMIILYAGTGLVAAAVLMIVFLAPGGAAAPAETDNMAAMASTQVSVSAGSEMPTSSVTPDQAETTVLPGMMTTPTDEPTSSPTPSPTVEPTPSPTPVKTTAPDPTPKPVDLSKLVKYYLVDENKYYNDMGYSNNHYDYTENEYYMLAQIIDSEARGESFEGKVAVGNVVMNRVLCRSFPGNNIKDVVTRPGQFAYNPSRKPASSSKRAARAILDDELWVIAQDVYYFRSGAESGVNWGSHKFYKKIGGHCFYRHSYSGRHRGGDAPDKLFERIFKYAQYGCKPEKRVYRIQYMLNKLGYDVHADKYFGEGTKVALMKFQEKKGLEADGVAGPSTVKALIKAYGLDKYVAKWGKD